MMLLKNDLGRLVKALSLAVGVTNNKAIQPRNTTPKIHHTLIL